jgi:hypothetical protein
MINWYFWVNHVLCCGWVSDCSESLTRGEETYSQEQQQPQCTDHLLDLINSDDTSNEELIGVNKNGEPILKFTFEINDEDSVDDPDYYRLYSPTGLPLNTSTQPDLAITLNTARASANEHITSMTETLFHDIVRAYDLVLRSCPLKYKRHLIKEYEVLIERYEPNSDTITLAKNYWLRAQDFTVGLEEQQKNYRLAISMIPSAITKQEWKKEYNAFIAV